MKLRKIRVYGSLRKFLKQSHFEAAVESPADAIKFLVCNFPKVEKHLNEQFYKIKMNNVQVFQDDLSLSGEGDIQIIPVAIGGLPIVGAIVSVATSAVTAVAAVATTAVTAVTAVAGAAVAGVGAVAAAGAAIASSGFIGNLVTTLLVNTAIDGVVGLLTPSTSIDPSVGSSADDSDPEDPRAFASVGFNQIVNVSVSGGAVPIIYGEVFTGSVVISASSDVQQVQSAG